MDLVTARWLVSPDAAVWSSEARWIPDPAGLSAGAALRRHLPPERAAAVLNLETLRREAKTKAGELAAELFWTRDGLEQATRWDVASWRAREIVATGVRRVVDAGCGLGIDALAYAAVGLEVVPIERDPVTAILCEANLRCGTASATRLLTSGDIRTVPVSHVSHVIAAPAEALDMSGWLADDQTAVYMDPARRTARGRSWRVEDLSPAWDFVQSVLARARGPVAVKLGPGFPRSLVPDGVSTTYVSHHGDLVETTLWSAVGHSGSAGLPGVGAARSEAVVLDRGGSQWRLRPTVPVPEPGPPRKIIYEPDPAVIRAGAVGALAQRLGAYPLAAGIAYLTGAHLVTTPFAAAFEVLEQMDFSVRTLRAWARDAGIGAMEIKVRGLDVDPAALRRQLRLAGKNSTCVILGPTTSGPTAFVTRRA